MATAPVSRSLSRIMLEESVAPGAAQNVRPRSSAEAQAQLLVLSRNPDLIDVVRNAAHSIAKVAHAHDLDAAARILPRIDPGVVVVDGSIAADISASITKLTQQFPEVVTVIVGTRDESAELMQLTAAGRIFRFLLMPLAYGPVRLALAAAVAQHFERKAANRRLAFAFAALAVALLVVIGGLWVAANLLVTKPAVAGSPAAPAVVAASLDSALTQLARAAEAMAQGQYVEPSGGALDLYRNALELDPRSDTARAGIRAIADEFLQRAEQALLAEELEAADRALAQVRDIEAGHPRLAFLDTQLARERERRNLSQRRDVSNRVRKLVGEARSDMQVGNLIGSTVGGALGALLEARRLDRSDPSVIQSIRELNAAIADAVRLALTAGDTQRAQAFANAARRLGAGSQLLAAVDRSVAENSRRSVAAPVKPPSKSDAAVLDQGSTAETLAKTDLGAAGSGDPEVVQAADVPRTKQVMPIYPKQAATNGTEGYVDLDFTISAEGIPSNLKVRDAVPRRVFDSAALSCVRQWRWEPIVQNGVAVSRPATLRLRFQLLP